MLKAFTVAALALLPLSASQALELRGQVFWLAEDGSRHFEAGAEVRVEESRSTTQTDDSGFFRLVLPGTFRPGEQVTLFVETPERVIFAPAGGEVTLPANPDRVLVDIELVRRGSYRLLSDDRLAKLLDDLNAELVRLRSAGRSSVDLDATRILRRWAASHGFGLDEVQREIRRWSDEVLEHSEDGHERGLAELGLGNFDAAAESFASSVASWESELARLEVEQAGLRERRQELLDRLVRDLWLESESAYNACDSERAVATMRKILLRLRRWEDPFGWAEAQRSLSLGLRQRRCEPGAEIDPVAAAESVAAARAALEAFDRENYPLSWARAAGDLGEALTYLGRAHRGQAAAESFAEAVASFRAALEIWEVSAFPRETGLALGHLGNVLRLQAQSSNPAEQSVLLTESAACQRRAWRIAEELGEVGDARVARGNLALTLRRLARSESPLRSRELLEESIDLHRALLADLDRAREPYNWALTQAVLGQALRDLWVLAGSSPPADLLAEAEAALGAALEVWNPENARADWSTTQGDLGDVLVSKSALAADGERVRILDAAADAYKAGLSVLDPAADPEDWGRLHFRLGNALLQRGQTLEGEPSRAGLVRAAVSYRAAIEAYSRIGADLLLIDAQEQLVHCLLELAWRLPAAEAEPHLLEALDLGRKALALAERSESSRVLGWIQADLGNVLGTLGQNTPGDRGRGYLEEALVALDAALAALPAKEGLEARRAALLDAASVLLALGRREEAARRLEVRAEAAPEDLDGWLTLAGFYLEVLLQPASALAALDRAPRSGPMALGFQLTRIELLFANLRFEEGDRELRGLGAAVAASTEQDQGAVLAAYRLAYGLVLGKIDETEAALVLLRQEIQDLSEGGSALRWQFTGTRHAVEQAADLPRHQELQALFRALDSADPQAIFAVLLELEGSLERELRRNRAPDPERVKMDSSG